MTPEEYVRAGLEAAAKACEELCAIYTAQRDEHEPTKDTIAEWNRLHAKAYACKECGVFARFADPADIIKGMQ